MTMDAPTKLGGASMRLIPSGMKLVGAPPSFRGGPLKLVTASICIIPWADETRRCGNETG